MTTCTTQNILYKVTLCETLIMHLLITSTVMIAASYPPDVVFAEQEYIPSSDVAMEVKLMVELSAVSVTSPSTVLLTGKL